MKLATPPPRIIYSNIYFDRRRDANDGIFYTSPLQVYLELAVGGKREQETAAQSAERFLLCSFGPVTATGLSHLVDLVPFPA